MEFSIHPRSLARSIAKNNMIKAGCKKINKHRDKTGKKVSSSFAQNWRRYATNN